MKRVWLGLILLLGFFLRVHELGRENFWLDESYGWGWVAHSDWFNLWAHLQQFSDVTPLFYALNKFFEPLFGLGEFGFRLPSALVGWLAIGATYRLGKTLFNSWVGVWAALFIALSPYAIWHARDARPYSLYLLGGAMVWLGFWRAERGKGWGLFIVASLLWYLNHYLSALFVYAQVVYILINFKTHRLFFRRWFVAQVMAALPLAVWLLTFIWRQGFLSANTWIKPPTIFTPLQTLWNYFTGDAVRVDLLLIGGALGVLGFISWGLRDAWRQHRSAVMFLLCWALTPLTMGLLFSLRQPAYVDRYFVPVLLAVALGVGYALANLTPLWRRLALFGLVLFVGFNTLRLYRDPLFAKPVWRPVTQFVERQSLPVVAWEPEVLVVLDPYLKQPVQYQLGRTAAELDAALAQGRFLFLVVEKPQDAHALSDISLFDPLAKAPPHFVTWLNTQRELKVTSYPFLGAGVIVVEP